MENLAQTTFRFSPVSFFTPRRETHTQRKKVLKHTERERERERERVSERRGLKREKEINEKRDSERQKGL